MRNTYKKTHLFAGMTLSLLASAAFAGSDAIWSYAPGAHGPEQWGSLAAGWGACESGRYQSPINITDGISADLGDVKAAIKSTPLAFGLDGPTFAVHYEPGSWLTIDGARYELQQFHFHTPSEHALNGERFEMEGHLVLKEEGVEHANAVLGVFIKQGSENAMLDQFWGVLPRYEKKDISNVVVNVGELLPKKTAFFMYEGSMTTPTCSQSVRWYVLEEPVEASRAQIDAFVADLTEGYTNNRPLQSLHGRAVLKGN